jgi:integrase
VASIRKRANRWQVQVRRKHAPLISKSFLLKADAEAWARSMEVEADKRTLQHDPRLLDSTSLGDLVRMYRDTVCQTKKGRDVEVILLNAFLRHPIALKPLSAIKTADFARYRDERLKVVSPSGLNRELSPLQHMFSVAKSEWGLPITENPVAALRKPRNNPGRERRLKQGDLEKLLEAARATRRAYLAPAITLAVETAMRQGEILNIRPRDFSEGLTSLRIPITKTGKPRVIPLSKAAVGACEELLKAFKPMTDECLIPVTSNAFKLAWKRTVERAQIEDLHFHDLRHEAVSRLFEQGRSMPEVAAISGHRDFRMLARYSHLGSEVHWQPTV